VVVALGRPFLLHDQLPSHHHDPMLPSLLEALVTFIYFYTKLTHSIPLFPIFLLALFVPLVPYLNLSPLFKGSFDAFSLIFFFSGTDPICHTPFFRPRPPLSADGVSFSLKENWRFFCRFRKGPCLALFQVNSSCISLNSLADNFGGFERGPYLHPSKIARISSPIGVEISF